MDQAIFLLAGRSSRFEGIVPHKCLLRLAGQTVLERQIIQAANLGVRDFVFGLGAEAWRVEQEALSVLRQVPYHSALFVLNNEYAETGSWTTLRFCMERAGFDDVMVLEGDVVVRMLPVPTRCWHRSQWIVVDGYEGDGSFVGYDDDGLVMLQKRSVYEVSAGRLKKSAGIFYLDREDASEIYAHDAYDYQILDEFLAERYSARALPIAKDSWWELDNVDDFASAREALGEEDRVAYHPDPVLL